MASKDQLRKVAIYCDEYTPIDDSSLKSEINTTDLNVKSCENCKHFTREGKCNINLVDKVLSNLAMELDSKK